MKIDTGIELVKSKDTGNIVLTMGNTECLLMDKLHCTSCEAEAVYKAIRRTIEAHRLKVYKSYVEYFEKRTDEGKEQEQEQKEEVSMAVDDQLKRGLNNMINFFIVKILY